MRRPSPDAVLLFILLMARVRIDTLAEWAAIPTAMLQADVARLVGSWWPAESLRLLADRQTSNPISLVLISLAFGLFVVYLVLDMLAARPAAPPIQHLKLGLIGAIIAILVGGQTLLYIGLRHVSGPAAYTHDGGVIQTEITIQYLLSGVNPYVADYLDTPMAAWGTEYRTALYHYPYLPWTFLFSAPFYLLSRLVLGWYDQRFLYLALFGITLVLAYRLARRPRRQLAVLSILGLNPILASDVIFGQNDAFVLFWIVLGVWLLQRVEVHRSGVGPSLVAFGLACASKPTAWFLLPFLACYLLRDLLNTSAGAGSWLASVRRGLVQLARRGWPLVLVCILVIGPWLVWDAQAMFDDIWRWSAGTATTPYQIRGWGLSNFVLALGLVADRLAYWPFWVLEVLVAAPLLVLLIRRQASHNELNTMLYAYALLLFAFLYVSRFLNENYLGYLLSLLALAACLEPSARQADRAVRNGE